MSLSDLLTLDQGVQNSKKLKLRCKSYIDLYCSIIIDLHRKYLHTCYGSPIDICSNVFPSFALLLFLSYTSCTHPFFHYFLIPSLSLSPSITYNILLYTQWLFTSALKHPFWARNHSALSESYHCGVTHQTSNFSVSSKSYVSIFSPPAFCRHSLVLQHIYNFFV